jgi:hypothetical protein
MAGTKRTTITRRWRSGRFSREVLDLFLDLEAVPRRERWESDEWKDGSKRLAGLLGLSTEWWRMTNVHDTGPAPPRDLAGFDYRDWRTCCEVRLALLAAVMEAGPIDQPVAVARPVG